MTEKPPRLIDSPGGYAGWVADLKTRIASAQQRAAFAVFRGSVEDVEEFRKAGGKVAAVRSGFVNVVIKGKRREDV
jgi:hypothetical protein